MAGRESLLRFAWLSIAAAVVTIALKGGAYFLTGSVGLLSDAIESLVNLVAAIIALIALAIAARGPDEERPFGYEKAEYFSSGAEGGMILVAAVAIIYTAVERLFNPEPLTSPGIGLAVSTLASVVNFAVALRLRHAGRVYESITLEADAQHLMTDVWTSVGVIVGVGAVAVTGWQWLDPVVALAVAVNIVRVGIDLLRRSAFGLLDTAIAPAEREAIQAILGGYAAEGVTFHAVRTRQAGARRFISLHVLVPGAWSVQQGHDLLEAIERNLRQRLPSASLMTHMEPIEDPVALEDMDLDRLTPPASG